MKKEKRKLQKFFLIKKIIFIEIIKRFSTKKDYK